MFPERRAVILIPVNIRVQVKRESEIVFILLWHARHQVSDLFGPIAGLFWISVTDFCILHRAWGLIEST